jgi:hypothetical protein
MRIVSKMSQDEKIAIVQRGVNAFAKVETALEQAMEGLNELSQIYMEGSALDMASGGWVVKERAKFARFIGRIGELQEDVYASHERGTAVAKSNDADVAIPQGYATVLSGGR